MMTDLGVLRLTTQSSEMERAHRPLELELGPALFPLCLTSRL